MKQSIHPLAECLLRLPYEDLSRGELLTRYVRLGDVRAFEVLLRRGTPLVLARCRKDLHDPTEAEEVVAEVFALLAVKASRIRDPERIDTWLARTVENLCRNRNRKAARRRSVEQPLPAPGAEGPELAIGPLPDVQAELREQHRLVLAEIERLSETLRRTLEVVQQTGSYGEAAAALGCTLAKVKQDVCRARRQLLARLHARGIVVPASLAAVLFGAEQGNASARLPGVARWLARKWVYWMALAAAGVGVILLVADAPPSAPDGPLPAATAPERETLQAKNLRIFHAEVEPKLLDVLGKLGGGEARVNEVRADGSEIICLLEGTKAFPGASKPPRARMRYCVLARCLHSELDLFGTGDWKAASADMIIIRPEFNRKPLFEVRIPLDHLSIRQAFELLPPDDRALEEFNVRLRHEPASTAAEFMLPGLGWWGVAGNSRYLYVVHGSGLLLASDGQGSFRGWQCIGLCDRQPRELAANDHCLYRVREDGQITVRPAELVVHEWRAIGPALSGGGPLCAGRNALYCAKDDFSLWSRPLGPEGGEWRQVGTVPGGQQLAVVGDRLWCLSTRDGKPEVWSRPIEGDSGAWERDGDYPPLKVTGGWLNQLSLQSWGNECLAWSLHDDRIFARPVGQGPHPWRQIGKKGSIPLRRW